MKFLYFLIFILICHNTYSQLPADNTIELKYISSMVRSSEIILPSKFDSAFASGMYTDTIIKKPELFAKLWNSYKDITYSKEHKKQDIRYKLTLYFSVYMPPVIIYLNAFYDSFDDKGLIKNGSFLKTVHHIVDAVIYKKPI